MIDPFFSTLLITLALIRGSFSLFPWDFWGRRDEELNVLDVGFAVVDSLRPLLLEGSSF